MKVYFKPFRSLSPLLLAVLLGIAGNLPLTPPAQADCGWFCPAQETIVVHDAQELLQAIGSNRKIILKPNLYLLSPKLKVNNPHLNYDHGQLWIEQVDNLTIQGEDLRSSKIVIEDTFSQVLSFRNSHGITLDSVELGHVPPSKAICLGAVLGFFDSSDIHIRNTILFGSGSFGIWAERSHDLLFENSVIKECSQGLLWIFESHHFRFEKATFVDNVGGVNLAGQIAEISFADSQFVHNDSRAGMDYTPYLFGRFDKAALSGVSVRNCVIGSNQLKGLSDRAGLVVSDNQLEANRWQP